jgi:hypothetical protein
MLVYSKYGKGYYHVNGIDISDIYSQYEDYHSKELIFAMNNGDIYHFSKLEENRHIGVTYLPIIISDKEKLDNVEANGLGSCNLSIKEDNLSKFLGIVCLTCSIIYMLNKNN